MSNYRPRNRSQHSPVSLMLTTEGIAEVPPVYGTDILRELNAALDPLFEAQSAKTRAYVTIDDMAQEGLLGVVLGGGLRDVLLSIVPDPVLYHFHAYEIAGCNTRPHIFGDNIAGWHRDQDSEHFRHDTTHASVFIYLTNVGPGDGPFEFSPVDPTKWVRSRNPSISVTGAAGYSFAFNRNFYHRASPNTGPVRRRLLKLSIQPNMFVSTHSSNANFAAARDLIEAGDPYMDLLLGRYQGMAPPLLQPPLPVTPKTIQPTGSIDIPDSELTRVQMREKARAAGSWLKRRITGETARSAAGYD